MAGPSRPCLPARLPLKHFFIEISVDWEAVVLPVLTGTEAELRPALAGENVAILRPYTGQYSLSETGTGRARLKKSFPTASPQTRVSH